MSVDLANISGESLVQLYALEASDTVATGGAPAQAVVALRVMDILMLMIVQALLLAHVSRFEEN